MGGDAIPNEAWKYGGDDVEKWVWEICGRIWRGEEWPEQWKEGEIYIIPLVKKGEGQKVKDYRGITLMPSLYKIYTITLGERLREEIEKKDLLPENQAGFRRGMGTIDQTFTLNYLINRQLGKVKGGLTVLFVDLKAAFDSVDRDILIRTMRERGVREGLIDRIEVILRETKSKVRIENQCSEEFWLAKGLRQGCTISPMLFNLLIADMKEYMARRKWEGIKIMGSKSYTLMYADDVALMAEDEQGMKAMISRLERYLEEKRLNLNVEKTKIIRFRKGGGRRHKVDWRWKGKKIEVVREFKYLGYTMMQNGGQEAHIRERRWKAALIMREVWGIVVKEYGERTGKGEYGYTTRLDSIRVWSRDMGIEGKKRNRRVA